MDETLLMPVHVKIFIALKIWAAFKARMLHIPTNNTRAVELCSRLHVCCVLSGREHGNAKRRDLLSFFILCLCRCGWSYHHQHPDKPQQWTEAGYCLCLSEENQKGSKIRRNNSYLIFFLWVVRLSGLVHLTINCEQMRSYYWAYCFTGSKDAFTLFESVEDFLAVAEITMGDKWASQPPGMWVKSQSQGMSLFEGRSGEAWKHSYLFVYCMATLHKENILFTWVVWMRKDCSQLCWSSIDMKQSDILSWTCQKYMHSSVDGKRSLKCLQQSA